MIPIRTSDRSYFKRCRQLWDFTSAIRQNLEPFQRAEALDFGTAIHRGLQAYYEPTTWRTVNKEANAIVAFLESISDVEKLVVEGPIDFEIDFQEQRMLGLGMLDNYFKWAAAHDEFTPVYVEVEFEVPIPGHSDSAVYQGRIDLIVEDEHGYWIVDHKTASAFRGTEWLVLDDQCSSYAWALQRQLGLEVRGVIYNELRKKLAHPPTVLKNGELSRSKSQETTYDLYVATIEELGLDYADYLETLRYYASDSAQQYVRRTQVMFSRQTLELVERRIQLEAVEMIRSPSIYPSPSSFNCTGCRFFAPCVALQEGADYEAILAENYQRRTD